MPLRYRFALLLTAALALQVPARAQFAFGIGGPGSDVAEAVALDGSTVYVAGRFEQTADFDAGPATVARTSAGGSDAFLAAYTEGTTAPRWVVALGSDAFDGAAGVAVGPDGHVYATGHFGGTVDFDPGPDSFPLTATGDRAAFVASYTAAGAFRWAFALGETGFGTDLAADEAGVYVTGGFTGVADFDPGPGTALVLAFRDQDAYVAAYTPDGAYRWAFNLGSNDPEGATYDEGTGLDARGGHVWVTGTFSSGVDFDPGPGEARVESGIGANDVFVARYTTAGAYTWAFGFGDDRFDGGNDVATDEAGNCYVTGFFSGPADFDPGPGVQIVRSAFGTQDGFVASYTAAGQYRSAFNIGSGGFDNAHAVAWDAADGGVYVGGSFGETVDFDPGPDEAERTATAYDDLFVAGYYADGTFAWANHAGDPPRDGYYPGNFTYGLAIGPPIACDPCTDARVVAVGSFMGTVDVDPGADVFTLVSAGESDAFVIRYSTGGSLPSVAAEAPPAPSGASLALSTPTPNPTAGTVRLSVAAREAQTVRVEVLDALGRRVALLHDGPLAAGASLPLAFDAARLVAGVYVVRATGEQAVAVRRVSVVR